MGATGHGRAWQMLAAAFEKAVPKPLVDAFSGGLDINLGRTEGAHFDDFGQDLWWMMQSLPRARDDDPVVVAKVGLWVSQRQHCMARKLLDIRSHRMKHWPCMDKAKYALPVNVISDPREIGWAIEA